MCRIVLSLGSSVIDLLLITAAMLCRLPALGGAASMMLL
jgi:hypothetical protein